MNAQGHLETIQMTRDEVERTAKVAKAAVRDADLTVAVYEVALRVMDKAIRDSEKAELEPAS